MSKAVARQSKFSPVFAPRLGVLILILVLAFVVAECVPLAQAGNFDGPAELPRVTVSSGMSDTPAPGSIISVNAGGDVKAALASARCGDVIELQAGATFSGQFTLPAKNCDSKHWIVIRTSASDSMLPAQGQRATPCYAGVGLAEVIVESRVDFPALGKPTKPISASSLSSRVKDLSTPGSPG